MYRTEAATVWSIVFPSHPLQMNLTLLARECKTGLIMYHDSQANSTLQTKS